MKSVPPYNNKLNWIIIILLCYLAQRNPGPSGRGQRAGNKPEHNALKSPKSWPKMKNQKNFFWISNTIFHLERINIPNAEKVEHYHTYATFGNMWKSAVCIFSRGFPKRENSRWVKSGVTLHGEARFVICDMETFVGDMYVDFSVKFVRY